MPPAASRREDVYKLRVIANDDKANPTEATNSVRKLIDRDGVKYLLGFCCSGPTSAVASFIERENALMLVGNAAERAITAKGFRTCSARGRRPTSPAPPQVRLLASAAPRTSR